MICKSCGTLHTTVLPGSGAVEATLWALIPCWPAALVYSVWRRSSRRRACAKCGSADVVGLDTPVGRALARQHYPGGLPPLPVPPPAPRVLGAIVTALAIFTPFALLALLSARP